ncbi:putative phage abortive infection protein [Acinetobacter sp. Tol 5]|uniref:putative phage abortive infection protein n=1 Tax=Acinetobacter sp. (strain Tol 5) TaxID=710648 RepID=UPI001C7505B2|nr:putative phage abortive infection protein [Acinetobacter sp. Tol 5]BCX74623.1 hypothetical protein TOL5_28230 [Acinetobacter sp. Tol 5]
MELKQFIKILVGLLIFIILIVISIFYMHYRIYNWVESAEAWGQFGDYIGGTLNPILTFCSFLALLITIILQNKQLDVSTRELHNTNITLNDSKRVMSEQLLTQSLQQFDSIFFAMLKDLNTVLLELENKGNNNKSILRSFHDEVFDTDTISDSSIENVNKKILLQRNISRYFMFLYQILKIVDNRLNENKNIPKENKKNLIKMYNNILRASVSEEAMQLLMINCLNESFEGFKILIEESNFFEHTSFKKDNNYILILIHASLLYKSEAFDKSIFLKELELSNTYRKYIVKHNITTKKGLLNNLFTNISTSRKLPHTVISNNPKIEGYFCSLKLDKSDVPVGLLLDLNFNPDSFGRYNNHINWFTKGHEFSNLKTIFGSNKIYIIDNNSNKIVISIIFQEDYELSVEFNEIINEL